MSISAGTIVGYLDLDASKFKSALKDASEQLKGFTDKSNSAGDRFQALGGSLKTIGSNMSKYVTLPLAGIGTASVATAATFEKSMSQVAATMGMTAEEINNGSESYKKLEQAALNMGATTQFSASEASEALNYLALAGYDVEKSVETLPTVLNLAAAGGLELGYASDVMTDAMSALGLETSQAANFVDQLAKTSQKSNTSVGQLGEAILTVGGTAKVLAGGTTEMNTALGILADNGIKGAEGGTALRNVILSLSAPTDKAAKTMKELGLEVFDAQGNMRPLNEIFKDLDGTLSTMTQGEQTKVLSELFNKVDLKSVNALLANSGERFDELSGYIANADGAAADMADTMNNNLSGQLTLLKSGLEGAAISIGNALMPMIKVLVEWINNLVNWFNNLNPGIQTAITMFGLVVASIGPVLLIVGHLCIAIGGLITFFSAGGAGAGILSAAIGALSGHIGIAMAAITALIAVGVLLYNNWDTIKAKASEIWNSIKDTIMKAMNWLGEQLGFNTEEIFAIITDAWNSIKDTLGATLDVISKTVSDAWEGIKEIIDMTVGVIFTTVKKAWDDIKDALSMIGDAIQQLIDGDWEGAKETIRQMNEKIKEIVSMAWDKIKVTLSQAGEAIKNIAEQAWNKIKVTINQAMENIKTAIKNGWENIKNATKTACDNVKKIAKTVFDGIKDDISKALSNVFNTAKSWWGKITNIFKNPIKAVVNLVQNGAKALLANNFIESQESLKENDYTKARFDYARAKQTTVSDVIATNYSMIEGLKDFAKGIKTDNKQANVNTENSISINLNIDKFVNERKQDVKEFMEEMAFEVRRQRMSFGGVR